MTLCFLAAMIGFIALQPSGSPVLLMLLAIFWGHASTRASAFCVGFSYSAATAATLTSALLSFFPGLFVGWTVSVWVVYATIGGSAFAACWPSPSAPIVRRISLGLALLVVLAVPPMGAVFWGHPVLAASELFPSMGLAGIAATCALWSVLGALRLPLPYSSRLALNRPSNVANSSDLTAWLIAMVTVSLVVHSQYDFNEAQRVSQARDNNAMGVDFSLGRLATNQVAQYQYLNSEVVPTVKAMAPLPGSVILLPESIAGVNTAARLRWWRLELDDFFAQGGTLVMGENDVDGKGIGVVSNTGYRYFRARQSTPLAEWRPESSYPSFGLWSNVATLRNGQRVALINCYEALTVWPLLLDLARDPDMLLFASNQFWANGTRAPAAMSSAMASWAKIAGVPLVSAINR